MAIIVWDLETAILTTSTQYPHCHSTTLCSSCAKWGESNVRKLMYGSPMTCWGYVMKQVKILWWTTFLYVACRQSSCHFSFYASTAYHNVHHGCCHKVAVLCWLDLLLKVVLSSVDMSHKKRDQVTTMQGGFCSWWRCPQGIFHATSIVLGLSKY